MLKIGLDVGSTTIKCIVLDPANHIVFKKYQRHFSMIQQSVMEMLEEIQSNFSNEDEFQLAISGSAGMGLAQSCGIEFFQEVYATKTAVNAYLPGSDVVIELGGEDAKILFLSDGIEVCMNGSCAGGTGAFIDQIAALLHVDQSDFNKLALSAQKMYPIASRCGVFAKSDIQPLLNQGADKADIASSVLQAVVNQTISGLAHGRSIEGNVVYLGGPCTFNSSLRDHFDNTLSLKGTCPENSLYYVAIGTALMAQNDLIHLSSVLDKIRSLKHLDTYKSLPALFENEEEREAFKKAHPTIDPIIKKSSDEKMDLLIGIDAGSTTLKAAVINEKNEIVYSSYLSNAGNPIPLVRQFLLDVYEAFPNARIKGSACTGYGEEMIKHAFHIDEGLVETIAHYKAAASYDPDVDFIIDIGGQDIKCFEIHNGIIDHIFLNEACSSGCGSFIQTFAQTLGYSMEDFTKLALKADKPVDLGSRCTVFMNSSVKEAQKDGVSIENIAAGLSYSVVKNALYKVIRLRQGQSLGSHIIVQGGTFLNDSILRAFEKELNQPVIRSEVSGLMGAYGAALFIKEKNLERSSLLNKEELENFTHKTNAAACKGCSNNCRLTINIFSDGSRYIAGNQCSKPVTGKKSDSKNNMYAYKRQLLQGFENTKTNQKTIGLLMGLNQYELLPFWHTLLSELGFGVEISGPSSKELFAKGQSKIISDTICFPAKLMHGHLEDLKEKKVDAIFYPCLSYNINENNSDDHYNCPVVAYYPEVLKTTLEEETIPFIYPYLGIDHPRHLEKVLREVFLKELNTSISPIKMYKAVQKAYRELENVRNDIILKTKELIDKAQEEHKPLIILAGRPYHIDPEINHGIDEILQSLGGIVISEEGLPISETKPDVDVLNQWTYHARLFNAAKWIVDHPEIPAYLVQLVSFGCGIDAITTDEVKGMLEEQNQIYTQLKIDEITNTGAVKIRLRSLFAAIEERMIQCPQESKK